MSGSARATKSRPELVRLEGSPTEVGRTFGQVNARDVAADMKRFYRSVRTDEKISAQKLLKAGEYYISLVRRYAPHWLQEARALAAAAGVDVERYIICQGAKYRGINRPQCFTYYSAPNVNSENVTLFHKNRDSLGPQSAYVKGVRVPGKQVYRFMAIGDTADMGTSMALNENGLAVAADVGAKDPHPRRRGMMNTDLMRIIVERSGDADEALDLLREFHRDKVYAGGKVKTNWMLADRRGNGVRIYQSRDQLLVKTSAGGFLVMRDADPRGRLVKRVLSRHRGKVTSRLLNQLSRQEPVLNRHNISAFTAVIPPGQTDLFGYAHFAVNHAGKTLYVPLYMGVTAVPRILVDGTLFRLSNEHPFGEDLFRRCKKQDADLEEFEEEMDLDRAHMERVARQVLRRQGKRAARQVLTQGCLRFARRAERILRLLRRGSGPSSDWG